jgi:hypothetical protein
MVDEEREGAVTPALELVEFALQNCDNGGAVAGRTGDAKRLCAREVRM